MSTSPMTRRSDNSCEQCNQPVEPGAAFCGGCGTQIAHATPITGKSPVTHSQEFERQLRVAVSCVEDVQGKTEEIARAKNVADRAIDDDTFRDTMAKAAYEARLHNEFNHTLDMAWKSAETAAKIDATGSIEIDGLNITPTVIFATVCSLRGDLMFALEKWDEAVGFYTRSLQFVPNDPTSYHNIAAAYTNKHDPARALAAFQRVIELDPTGHDGIEAAKAIEKLRSGFIGRKGFTGSWKVVAVLGGLTLLSMMSIGQIGGPAVANLILWGGILALYCWRKYK